VAACQVFTANFCCRSGDPAHLLPDPGAPGRAAAIVRPEYTIFD